MRNGEVKAAHEHSHEEHRFQNNDNKNSCKIRMRAKFIGHEDAITSLSIVYNESYFVSSSIDLSIRLWDIKLNVCLHVYKAHLSTIWNVKFARQGNFSFLLSDYFRKNKDIY